jgi:hypothetical protein
MIFLISVPGQPGLHVFLFLEPKTYKESIFESPGCKRQSHMTLLQGFFGSVLAMFDIIQRLSEKPICMRLRGACSSAPGNNCLWEAWRTLGKDALPLFWQSGSEKGGMDQAPIQEGLLFPFSRH